MLKRTFSIATLMLSAFAIAACSGGASSNDDLQAQQARDSKVLEDLYSGVQGTWSGTVTNPAGQLEGFDAELKVYVHYVSDGTNSDGTPKLRPTLNARFQPKQFATETDMMTMVGTYDRLGRFVMSVEPGKSDGTPSAPGQTLSIRGSAGQDKMTVELSRTGGVWGTFTATRTSTASAAPRSGEVTEYRERFYRIYGAVEGKYRGRMRSVDGNDHSVQIGLVILEKATASGYSLPVLMAQYSRLDSAGSLDWTLTVDYNTQTGGILMSNAGGSGSPGACGGGGTSLPGLTMSVTGKLTEVSGVKQLDVRVRNATAVIGDLTAVRASGSPRAPELPASL